MDISVGTTAIMFSSYIILLLVIGRILLRLRLSSSLVEKYTEKEILHWPVLKDHVSDSDRSELIRIKKYVQIARIYISLIIFLFIFSLGFRFLFRVTM